MLKYITIILFYSGLVNLFSQNQRRTITSKDTIRNHSSFQSGYIKISTAAMRVWPLWNRYSSIIFIPYDSVPNVEFPKINSCPYDLEDVINIKLENRALNLSFVQHMVTLNEMSTLSFTPIMQHSYYLKNETGRKTYGLEIFTVPVINLGGKNWYGKRSGGRNDKGRARWLQTAVLIPASDVRIYMEDDSKGDWSLPVRTPSYLQGGAYYFTHAGLWKKPTNIPNDFWRTMTEKEKKHWSDSIKKELVINSIFQRFICRYSQNTYEPIYKSKVTSWFGMLKGFHHSNGQDGGNRTKLADSIIQFAYWNKDGTLNTYNGDFGLNVVFEAALAFQLRTRIKGQGVEMYRQNLNGKSFVSSERMRSYTFSAGWQFVPPKLVGMKQLTTNHWYATNRLKLNLTFINSKKEQEISQFIKNIYKYYRRKDSLKTGFSKWYAFEKPKFNEKFRIITDFTYLTDIKLRRGNLYGPYEWINFWNIKRRLNLVLTAHARIRGTGNASLFIQTGYYGSDPYNMQFMTSRFFWRFGIGWGFFINGDYKRDSDGDD